MRKTKNKTTRRLLAGLTATFALLGLSEGTAQAQEILLTGPLAGAPAVRKLRLYREGRFEVSPAISFSLLDEYERTIFLGVRANYNFTDWFAAGFWGGYGGLLQLPTALTERTQDVNAERRQVEAARAAAGQAPSTNSYLTAVNMGPNFEEQLGSIDWIFAPQATLVPFRGKLALFQSLYVDTDIYFFAGPAIAGVSERVECGALTDSGTDLACVDDASFERESRIAFAPTFGLGFTFYINKWNAVGFEWRAVPFPRNVGGFDNRGGGPDGEFPDLAVNDKDREFKFNQMLTISYNFYFPQQYRVSE